MTGSILAVDFGERRIGLAVSDPGGIIASPRSTLDTRKVKNPVGFIAEMAEKEHIHKIVVGYPYHTDGTVSDKARDVDRFIACLVQAMPSIAVERFDERYSSVNAGQLLKAQKKRKHRDKKRIDRFAAAIFLQEYLDANR